eukprot:CAMPEP_0195331548 /NCGR_PEP_ID=MMETSP0708-20121125/12690_1 /TAXON_ID=33640 /ORGANISM="Asterionellopsis glacialis, Strain CCMP134" /LENGTH=33 /DNA_ID= /DNA_START= /DNA_END= /DNA_ORIENTATION=
MPDEGMQKVPRTHYPNVTASWLCAVLTVSPDSG